jgi:hypothetical protein
VIESFPTAGSIETIPLLSQWEATMRGNVHISSAALFIEPCIKLSNEPSWKETRRFPMKHLIISPVAIVVVLTTATTMLSSYSPTTERHAAGTVIGHCKNFHSLAGTKASELLPY